MSELVQILGALAVLAGYALAQAGLLEQRSYAYLLLNLDGSAILAAMALVEWQMGFLLLEGVWALVSLWGFLDRALGRAPSAMH